ncbi:MAG TPA: hypothetical protein VNR65_14945 [Geobacterales bacterium]|nr:hypothetical protein [Geobacterales bacterium]
MQLHTIDAGNLAFQCVAFAPEITGQPCQGAAERDVEFAHHAGLVDEARQPPPRVGLAIQISQVARQQGAPGVDYGSGQVVLGLEVVEYIAR